MNDRSIRAPSNRRSPLPYPAKLDFAQLPTPLQFLPRLSKSLGGVRVWVKRDDLTHCSASGNKIRKLEFVLAQAIIEGADTIITCGGLQSNHCRATAILGAQMGLKVHLILRGEPEGTPPDGNLLLDHLAGAEVSYYPRDAYKKLPALFDHWKNHYQQQGHTPYLVPTGASDGVGAWGYIKASEELSDQFADYEINPSAIVCATGSGGTQAGLTMGNALYRLKTRVVGMAVCDDALYFHNKVRADMQDWKRRYDEPLDVDSLPIEVNDSHIGAGYAQASSEVFDTIRSLAAMEGLILDPVYSGKAFHGMLQEIRQGDFQDAAEIVFIHTGGLFGLFAQRQQLGISV